MKTPLTGLVLGTALTLFATTHPARAEVGVTADRIVFGQVAALNGPAAALGQGMRTGILAAFAEANKAGGVKGHQLDLISRDDGYEPNQSIAAAKQLIEQDKVFALIGSVGTPTSAAVQPIAAEAQMPFVGAFTGAEFLRDPTRTNVINVRASYFQETETMVEHLVADLGVNRIAIFYQDDAYGQAGLAGVKRALGKRNMPLAGEGTYERNTTAVKAALLALRKADPQAVIMVGAYQPSSEFIRLARAIKFSPLFVNISFVGTEALASALGEAGAGVVVTEVVPSPTDAGVGIVKAYQAALHAADPAAKESFGSLEGYIAGRLMVRALDRVQGEITRAALLDAIHTSGTFDLDGMQLRYGQNDNHGSDQVFLVVIQPDGTVRPVTRLPSAGG
jgi:branched-chain amino acid transport system substrate-binding protein